LIGKPIAQPLYHPSVSRSPNGKIGDRSALADLTARLWSKALADDGEKRRHNRVEVGASASAFTHDRRKKRSAIIDKQLNGGCWIKLKSNRNGILNCYQCAANIRTFY
jgi:hypothetical protein